MPKNQSRKERRTHSDEFKNQIVQLYQSGKRKCDIVREYDLADSVLDRWIKQAETSGSFRASDNLTEEQKELIELRKINKQLLMENDILKQAALIMGRKSI